MEKIIYNNKSKKILISLFVFVVIFNFIFPNFVMAAVTWEANSDRNDFSWSNKAIGSIQEIVNSIRTFQDGTIRDKLGIADDKKDEMIEKLKKALKDKIAEEFPDLDDAELEKVYKNFQYNKEKIEVSCFLKYVAADGGNWSFKRFEVTINLTDDDIETVRNKSDEEIEDIETETLRDVTPEEAARGQDPDGGPLVSGNDDSVADEVGGILLKPIFALVNFVADAIMRMLDGLMIDQNFLGQEIMGGSAANSPAWSGNADFTGKLDTLLGAKYPSIRYTPEKIFSGDVELLSIDFISNAMNGGPLETVRTTVASWYKALRLFAIIGLLSVLIYTGIKVMLSANAKDKAKYKEWILNWFLAVAILFSMHYIMSFVITVTDEISELLSQSIGEIKAQVTVDGSNKYFKTNLMGLCRFMVQSKEASVQIGYEVMYIALIVYTFKFTFVYLKRVLNMAFLTLIAPLIALMYPIDKMTDGSAQGFDMWLKEYIYNALLQPMHLLLYYILVGSAVSLAAENPIYGIVVLMFMTEAEKLLKKIFGFDKAHGGTVGGMGNAFAAGALASQAGNLMKQLGRGNSKGGNGDRGDNKLPEGPPRKKDVDNVDDFADTSSEEEEEEDHESDSNGSLYSAAGAYQNSEDPIADAKRERLEEMIADGQIDESELTDEQKELLGKKEPDPEKPKNPESSPPPPKPSKKSTDNSIPKSRFAQGAKAVGKRLAKPIWDFDKSGKYNGKRLTRKIVKGAVGLGVGTAAAAVQAGISITDGKYNAFEGIASFGAGFAGGSAVTGGVIDAGKSLVGTFEQGYHSADDPKQKAEWEDKQRARYHEDWSNRDDVNKIFKEKFGEDNFKDMKERAKVYTDRGYNDPKEVAKLMSTSNEFGWNDKETISHMNFKKQLQEEQSYKAVTDLDERGKYIDAYIQNKKLSGSKAERVRKQFDEKFKAVAQLDEKMRS